MQTMGVPTSLPWIVPPLLLPDLLDLFPKALYGSAHQSIRPSAFYTALVSPAYPVLPASSASMDPAWCQYYSPPLTRGTTYTPPPYPSASVRHHLCYPIRRLARSLRCWGCNIVDFSAGLSLSPSSPTAPPHDPDCPYLPIRPGPLEPLILYPLLTPSGCSIIVDAHTAAWIDVKGWTERPT